MSKLLVDEISDADNTGPVTVTDGAVVNRTGDGTIIDLQVGGTSVGTVGTESGSGFDAMYVANGDTGLIFQGYANDAIIPFTAASLDKRDAAIDLGYSGGRFKDLYLSGGVYLGGTGSANYLDDYEEGTWTPTISSGTVTYSAQRGRYTKIGRMVYVHCFISIASISGSSDTNIISGLPFVSKNDSNYPALASKTNGFDWGGARTMITFQVTPNSINISAVASGNNQTFLDVNTAGLAATDWIACTGHYVTDA